MSGFESLFFVLSGTFSLTQFVCHSLKLTFHSELFVNVKLFIKNRLLRIICGTQEGANKHHLWETAKCWWVLKTPKCFVFRFLAVPSSSHCYSTFHCHGEIAVCNISFSFFTKCSRNTDSEDKLLFRETEVKMSVLFTSFILLEWSFEMELNRCTSRFSLCMVWHD